ncbi:MAG: hypothetical protein ABWJ97_05095 [Thermoproteus sp.]
METAVAVELLRRGRRPTYHREKREVDFYIPEEGLYIQVTYASSWDEVDRKEVEALADAARRGGRALLVTWDLEGRLAKGGVAIEAVPLWRWLLGV